MKDYSKYIDNGSTVTIPKEEYVELLKDRLYCLEQARERDPSWNYPIEETKQQIKDLQS